ncbi:hypothetical protein TCE0_047r18101 [Talaromyces pinophilus]|uniref:Uncharacterized protein n=1 Tax=Talaromyces pinophilus TaxID=128442 RepID=A0A0B8N6Y6_TALPI|nr:hypothetical protein TCE0_047r18101 [Talaromyces pinophilus]
MQIESQGEIYFTLQQSELIASVIVANGAVIARGPSLQERIPENWISALREMAERLGKVKANEISSYAAEGPDFSLYDISNEMVNSDFFIIPPTPLQQLVGITDEQPTTTMSVLSAKRMKKLDSMFTGLRTFPVSALEHHNQQVDGLYNGPKFTSCPDSSIMQFAGVLSRLGAFSDMVGNIYGLLSWQIFKTEEDRLVNEEGMSPNFAAKQLKVVPPSHPLGYCSLDSLLKIAHFPTLRKRFEEQFDEFIQLKTPEWELLEASGYRVFGYEEFLRLRCPPPIPFGQSDLQILNRLLDRNVPLVASPTDPVLSLGAGGPEDYDSTSWSSPGSGSMSTSGATGPLR